MKKLFALFFGLFLFFCPLALQAIDLEQMPQGEIAEIPSNEALNYLMSEDIYQGSLSWQGNKTSTKFNYDKQKGK